MALRVSCMLDERPCTDCGECDPCDLVPDKICDNCCLCLGLEETDYRAIEIDDILLDIEYVKDKSETNEK
ncbi:MAG: hypothetical protein ACYC2T_00815 [Bacillota bacterium]